MRVVSFFFEEMLEGVLKEETLKGAHTKTNKRYAHPFSYALVFEKRKGSHTKKKDNNQEDVLW